MLPKREEDENPKKISRVMTKSLRSHLKEEKWTTFSWMIPWMKTKKIKGIFDCLLNLNIFILRKRAPCSSCKEIRKNSGVSVRNI